MIDRVPRYPGRVKMTPVPGQPNIYDMERADQPIQEGTKLNKASLASDQMLAKFGLTGENATPNGVLDWLAKYNEHCWERTKRAIEYIYDLYEGPSLYRLWASNYQYTYYSDSIEKVDNLGSVPSYKLSEPVSNIIVTRDNYTEVQELLKGKYFYSSYAKNHDSWTGHARMCYGHENLEIYIEKSAGNAPCVRSPIHMVDGEQLVVTNFDPVYSFDKNAYPSCGELNGITYRYLGNGYNRLRMNGLNVHSFSYIGNGSNNPYVLLDSIPDLLVISHKTTDVHKACPIFVYLNFAGEKSLSTSGGVNNDCIYEFTLAEETDSYKVSWKPIGTQNEIYNSLDTVYNVLCLSWQEVNQ